jgi:hypothetical protein
MKTFLIFYLFPFLFVFLGQMFNEYRLYKKGNMTYEAYINSVASILVGLLSFIIIQVAAKHLLK